MFTKTTISPAHANISPANAVRPLGELSDIACSDRLGGTIRCISLQEEELRPDSAQAIIDGIHIKIEKLDRPSLAELPEREKRIAALDLRMVIHGLRALCIVANSNLNNEIQDLVSGIIHEDLGAAGLPPHCYDDALDLDLAELLRTSPRKDPRGYTPQMRQDVMAASARSVAFVIEDMRGGFAYQGLQPFVNPDELKPQSPPIGTPQRRYGW